MSTYLETICAELYAIREKAEKALVNTMREKNIAIISFCGDGLDKCYTNDIDGDEVEIIAVAILPTSENVILVKEFPSDKKFKGLLFNSSVTYASDEVNDIINNAVENYDCTLTFYADSVTPCDTTAQLLQAASEVLETL